MINLCQSCMIPALEDVKVTLSTVLSTISGDKPFRLPEPSIPRSLSSLAGIFTIALQEKTLSAASCLAAARATFSNSRRVSADALCMLC